MTQKRNRLGVAQSIQAKLLEFYDTHKRELPWRQNDDPYRVWVSEIMLQQTRAGTVVPYYERWLQRYPDVNALATADIDDVLKSWEGLGYYSRARNLHKAAQVVREKHNGAVPSTYAGLKELPGIGDYTAGAIASIAFQKQEPVVDGNVSRVLHRLHDRPAIGASELRELARELVPAERPGDFNQALMELGATICTPRAPSCDRCPIHEQCRAFARGTQLGRPAPKATKAIPTREFITVVVRDARGRLLLRQRPRSGLLAGLWEFPELTHVQAEPHSMRELGEVTHVFSHFRAVYRVHSATVKSGRLKQPLRWVSLRETDSLALATAQRRILEQYVNEWAR